MDLLNAARIAADLDAIERALGKPLVRYAEQCHAGSFAVLRTGLFGPGRVARGQCDEVDGQHSWIVLGERVDVYDRNAVVVDPVLWSYQKGTLPYVAVVENRSLHHPHGSGDIWEARPPEHGGGAEIALAEEGNLPIEAKAFLMACGPLDRRGWHSLASGPMEGGWGAREIIAAMLDTPSLRAAVPIDIAGMLTDRNPNNLYW